MADSGPSSSSADQNAAVEATDTPTVAASNSEDSGPPSPDTTETTTSTSISAIAVVGNQPSELKPSTPGNASSSIIAPSPTTARSSSTSPSSEASSTSSTVSSPNSTKTQAVAGSSQIDPGALAGGIIGAFFGGVILALMAAFLFNRRRNQNSKRFGFGQNSLESPRHTSNRLSHEPRETFAAWQRLIPQAIDDEAMSNVTKSLLDQVSLHVDNFYARKTVQIPDSKLEHFAKIDTNLLPGPLAELMTDLDMQLPAIEHCVAFILTTKLMPGSDASESLLPPHLAILPRQLAPNSSDEKEVLGALPAYSVWKTLTSYLLPELADDPHTMEHRRQVTTSIVEDISAAFKDWETESSECASAADHLAKVADVAYDVGVKIASQPSSFRFEWQSRKRHGVEHARKFVVLPGFLKVVDETGCPLDSPQVLVRAVVRRLRHGR